MNKVEKPTKILTMGVGAYALTFIFCWVLFITPFLVPPNASFTMDLETPLVGQKIIFDASSSVDPDGEIVTYIWDFGDDTTRQEEVSTTTHTYTVAGEYTVELKVVDDHGISRSNIANIIVRPQS
jgi:PKD repeat protein